MEERLQKIIAHAGVASRRRAEQLILSGQVTLNGRVVTELGTKADAERDHIKVGGKLLHAPGLKIYLLLHKPAEVVATMSDPEGRRTLADLLHGVPGRVFPVGRLEYHAAGLLLLTNDGELANRLLRSHGWPQIYLLKLKGELTDADHRHLAETPGVRMRRQRESPNAWYEVTLSEARRDRLRRTLRELGHPVEKMKRIKLANLELASLPPGHYRSLTREEINGLARMACLPTRHVGRDSRVASADIGNRPRAHSASQAPKQLSHRSARRTSRETFPR